MKKIGIVLFLLLGLLSCDNTLDVVEPMGDLPIIYGLLDPSSDAQYIRIERAFVDPEVSALIIAQDVDSLYYPETATAFITNNLNDDVIPLTRINGNLQGLVRDEGVFAQDPNYLYTVDSDSLNIDLEGQYTLNLDRGDELPLVTASTNIVGVSRFISPNPLSPDPRLAFLPNDDTGIAMSVHPNGQIYDLSLEIFYVERMPGENFETRSFTWDLATNLRRSESGTNVIRFEQLGDEFFAVMAARIPVVEGIQRRFSSMNLHLSGANSILEEFLRVGQANLGITSTQDIPFFDNLSEGRGIFASRNTTSLFEIRLSGVSEDELINGPITNQLGFE